MTIFSKVQIPNQSDKAQKETRKSDPLKKKQSSETDPKVLICELSDKEFKITIIKILNKFRKNDART